MYKKEKVMTLHVLEALIAVSALIASVAGILFPDIYRSIVSDEIIPFAFAQDAVSLLAAVLLLVTTFFRKKDNIKLDIIRIGIAGYLFYAYGLLVMGTIYNYCYFLYLSVFGLSVFYFINAFSGIEYEGIEINVPNSLRIIIAVYCMAIAVFFTPQWIIAIVHYIQFEPRPAGGGFAFNCYVYILDLCFVLPVCAAASVFLFRRKILGMLLGGILSIKGFTLMMSVALGFICQPLFLQSMDVRKAMVFSTLSFVFLALSVLYFALAKTKSRCRS